MRLVTTKYQLVCNTVFTLFWVLATYNFVTQEAMGREVPSVELGVRLMAQGMLVVLGLWTLRSKIDIAVISIFTVFTLIGTCWVNGLSLMTWVDGVRLYVCFLFVVPILRYLLSDREKRTYFIHRMDRNLYRFLWLQAPCILTQFFRYNNLDLVGGSLGYMMSGAISNLIYLVSFYLMLRSWDPAKNYLTNLKDNRVLVFLLFLTFLNETKVSFVFLLFYFFFLIPMDRKFLRQLIWLLPLIAAVFGGALYIYINVTGNKDSVSSQAAMARYLMGDEAGLTMVENVLEKNHEFMETDMARGLKFIITPAIMNRNPPAWVWGYGIGLYKVGDSSNKNEFAKRYQWLLQGTMIQSHVVWVEMGLGGVALYFIYWLVMLKVFRRRVKRNKQLQWMLGMNVLVATVYNAPFFIIPFCIIFMYMILLSGDWEKVPAYKPVSILGSRPVRWSLKAREAEECSGSSIRDVRK